MLAVVVVAGVGWLVESVTESGERGLLNSAEGLDSPLISSKPYPQV